MSDGIIHALDIRAGIYLPLLTNLKIRTIIVLLPHRSGYFSTLNFYLNFNFTDCELLLISNEAGDRRGALCQKFLREDGHYNLDSFLSTKFFLKFYFLCYKN